MITRHPRGISAPTHIRSSGQCSFQHCRYRGYTPGRGGGRLLTPLGGGGGRLLTPLGGGGRLLTPLGGGGLLTPLGGGGGQAINTPGGGGAN